MSCKQDEIEMCDRLYRLVHKEFGNCNRALTMYKINSLCSSSEQIFSHLLVNFSVIINMSSSIA